jgi:hypothetical protein
MTTPEQQATDAQFQAPLFRCAECQEPVVVWGARFFRTCEHLSAPIIATPEAARVINAIER